MKTTHASDNDIQLFALDRDQCSHDAVNHIMTCEQCTREAAIYALLAKEISRLPLPAMDIEGILLTKPVIPATRKGRHQSIFYLPVVAASLMAIPLWYFRTYFFSIVRDTPHYALPFLLVLGLGLPAITAIQLYYRHHRLLDKLYNGH